MRFLSLFSGIEAASLAWLPLGWTCAAVAEIEPFPCAVLAHHYPDAPNLGDITRITQDQIEALGPVDLAVGGFPCQDVSIAGKRKGLTHEDGLPTRSGLFFDAMRLVRWARPRWLLLENVPGLFSSNGGADFAAVVGEVVGCRFGIPGGRGWRNSGAAIGPHGLLEWCVLDAQWFGVPQRRRRVFALADFGDWAGRPPILFESESLRGDPAPRREARQGIAGGALAGTSPGGGWRCGADEAAAGMLIHAPSVSPTLKARDGKGQSSDGDGVPLVAHALRADGFDASEDGTGRGTPLIPLPFDTTQITSATNRSRPKAGDPCHSLAAAAHAPAIAFDSKASGRNGFGVGSVSPTLRAMGHKNSRSNAGGQVAVTFTVSAMSNGFAWEREVAPTLGAHPQSETSNRQQGVRIGAAVRRLTPLECERLQGAPDHYTRIPLRNKNGSPNGKWAKDGPRYKALGNSFAVPVVRWIGERIDQINRLHSFAHDGNITLPVETQSQ